MLGKTKIRIIKTVPNWGNHGLLEGVEAEVIRTLESGTVIVRSKQGKEVYVYANEFEYVD